MVSQPFGVEDYRAGVEDFINVMLPQRESVGDLNPVAEILYMLVAVIGSVLSVPGAASAGTAELFRQQSLSKTQPTLMTPGEAIEGHRRGVLSDEEFENTLLRHGYSPRAREAFEQLQAALLSINDLATLYRRKKITRTELNERLTKQGIDGGDLDLIEEAVWDVPGVQDVVRFLVREVFSSELRAQLELDTDFPEESIPEFEAAGVRGDTAKDYWAAHWQLPSTQLAFTMLHRGEITEDQLDLILRANDVLPLFREPIKAVAYSPLTRVDVRRMHAIGLITSKEELIKRYKDLGFSDQPTEDNPISNAEMMANFTVEYNDRGDDQSLEVRDLTRTQITSFLEKGLYTPDQAIAELEEIGYSPEDANTIARLTAVKVLDRKRDEEVKVIKARYDNSTITLADAKAELDALDLTPIERDLITTQLERERQSKVRQPTLAQLTKFANEGLITAEDYYSELRDLGYSDKWATLFVALIGGEETKELSRSQIIGFLEAGIFTNDQALTELVGIGFSEGDAERIIELSEANK